MADSLISLFALSWPSWPVCIAIVCVLLGAMGHYTSPRPAPGVPFASYWTPLGHVLAMLQHIGKTGELTSFFAEQVAKHGDINERGEGICQVLMGPGEVPWIIVSGQHAVQDILSVRRARYLAMLSLAGQERRLVRPLAPRHRHHIRYYVSCVTLTAWRRLRRQLACSRS